MAATLCGLPAAQAAAASPQRAATVQAGQEEHCGEQQRFSGAGNGAKVKLCPKVDEAQQLMNIATGSTCFHPGKVWNHCTVTGSWKMYRGDQQIAEGTVNSWIPYVGPGTYTVVADVSAFAHDEELANFSGTRIPGRLTHTFTLASPKKDVPFTVEATPGHRDRDSETALTFDVTSKGEVDGRFSVGSKDISSTTPGCETKKRKRVIRDERGEEHVLYVHTFIVCKIAKGTTKTVEVTAAPRKGGGSCNVTYRLTWPGAERGIEETIRCS
ncbi:hypothetical protein AB0B50_39010 [Streptomyces sp. NPDC041068]|uniref:hypothetical protein n=1 Tax=Streptomyces sp. NPDC041068 TaxID=3155130 RepID=UPI0034091244